MIVLSTFVTVNSNAFTVLVVRATILFEGVKISENAAEEAAKQKQKVFNIATWP